MKADERPPSYSPVIIKYWYHEIFYILVLKSLKVKIVSSLVLCCIDSPCLACLALPCFLLSFWCLIALTFIVCKTTSVQVTVVHLSWSWGSLVLCTDLSFPLIFITSACRKIHSRSAWHKVLLFKCQCDRWGGRPNAILVYDCENRINFSNSNVGYTKRLQIILT